MRRGSRTWTNIALVQVAFLTKANAEKLKEAEEIEGAVMRMQEKVRVLQAELAGQSSYTQRCQEFQRRSDASDQSWFPVSHTALLPPQFLPPEVCLCLRFCNLVALCR